MSTRFPRQRYLKVLGLEPNADEHSIKTAFRRLAKQYHPDCSPEVAESCEKFKEIREAYECLVDPTASHDASETEDNVSPQPTEARRTARFARRRRPALWPFFSASHALPELELVLSQSEALSGTSLRLGLPLEFRCRRCGGFGAIGMRTCPACHGAGFTEHIHSITLRLPRGLRDGTRLRIPLENLDLVGVSLGATVRVR